MEKILCLGVEVGFGHKFVQSVVELKITELKKEDSKIKIYVTDSEQRQGVVRIFRDGLLDDHGLTKFGGRVMPIVCHCGEGEVAQLKKLYLMLAADKGDVTGVVLFSEQGNLEKCKERLDSCLKILEPRFAKQMPFVLVTSPQIFSGSFRGENVRNTDFKHFVHVPGREQMLVEWTVAHLFAPKEE